MSEAVAAITLEEATELVVREAALLDDWDTTGWSALFSEDGEYLVPSTDDPQGVPGGSLHLIHDDHVRIEQRAIRLLKRTAHAEYPHSRTTRIVSNVRVSRSDDPGLDRIDTTFVVYRSKRDRVDLFPGRAIYLVRRDAEGALRIRRKTAILGVEELRPQGKLSIIL